jgi:hypothetical protein
MEEKIVTFEVAKLAKDNGFCESTTESNLLRDILNDCNGTGGGLHHKMIKAKITVTVEFLK